MGSNIADFDNDGYLDFYLDTGEPCLSMVVLNRMFKNVAGQRFAEITATSGTGHLQKGHGVACGDWDRDGNVDLFVEVGGAIPGDRYHNVLFLNTFLQLHGPIWAAGQKNWDGANHGHVVVICGVADTGVFIHDPEPVNQGSSKWLTWDQLNSYSAGTAADVKYMTAA